MRVIDKNLDVASSFDRYCLACGDLLEAGSSKSYCYKCVRERNVVRREIAGRSVVEQKLRGILDYGGDPVEKRIKLATAICGVWWFVDAQIEQIIKLVERGHEAGIVTVETQAVVVEIELSHIREAIDKLAKSAGRDMRGRGNPVFVEAPQQERKPAATERKPRAIRKKNHPAQLYLFQAANL